MFCARAKLKGEIRILFMVATAQVTVNGISVLKEANALIHHCDFINRQIYVIYENRGCPFLRNIHFRQKNPPEIV